jgi:anthranilate phosphoribosyltransferase
MAGRDDAAGGVMRRRDDSLIEKIRAGNDLSAFDVQEAAAFLLSDSIEAKTKADFLTALHDKGESASEIASFVRVLLERAVPLEIEELTDRSSMFAGQVATASIYSMSQLR